MAVRWRRKSRSSGFDILRTSTPSTRTSPAVGSISRLMWRISVDLPEPDRPMITWISPAGMAMMMSLQAEDMAVRAVSSALVMPACARHRHARRGDGPKIL